MVAIVYRRLKVKYFKMPRPLRIVEKIPLKCEGSFPGSRPTASGRINGSELEKMKLPEERRQSGLLFALNYIPCGASWLET